MSQPSTRETTTINRYPEPQSARILTELSEYVIAEPFPFVVDLAQSRGLKLATLEGGFITDWSGLYGSRLLGYNHPRLFEADYVKRLVVAANTKMANPDFLTLECLDYYRLLHRLAPRCMTDGRVEVYAVNSGAEAVENMMKYLINLHNRKLQQRGHVPKGNRFIYFDQAFHGRTVFALNITQLPNDPVATRDFEGLIPGNLQVPFPAWDQSRPDAENRASLDNTLELIETLMRNHGDEISGVILEPLQGAGGHRLAHPDFYRRLSTLCKLYDIGWGLDEVQTSGGQTGAVFAIDLFDLPYPPNAVATAKKFGNGVVYMLNSMEDIGVLDSTWGGTLSDMVRFCEEWKIVESEGLIEAVPEKAKIFVDRLNALQTRHPQLIRNVRGLGLYQGFSLVEPAHKVKLIEAMLDQENMLLIGAGSDSIRFRPPLDIVETDMEALTTALDRALAQF